MLLLLLLIGCNRLGFTEPTNTQTQILPTSTFTIDLATLTLIPPQTPTQINNEYEKQYIPFSVSAPWEKGQIWMAGGGDLGGDYYEKGEYHKDIDKYALDFNASYYYYENGKVKWNTEKGENVLAVEKGKVVKALCFDEPTIDNTANYGCHAVINHGLFGDYCYGSRYAHLENPLLIEPGDNVSKGQVIGKAGCTGLSKIKVEKGRDRCHLHFAMYRVLKGEKDCSNNIFEWGDKNVEPVKPEPFEELNTISMGECITSTNSLSTLDENVIDIPTKIWVCK
jgi:murein DD-endopeptidase MepM/ murein hydrolase activator NlpD